MRILASPRPALEESFVASSVQEALAYLSAHHGRAQVVGGGTLVMPQVQRGELTATRLVDVSRIRSMRSIQALNQHVVMGGAVTFARVLNSEVARGVSPLVCQAARLMGTPQVRHLATVAGNIVSASGPAEGAVALVALDAEAQITNFTGDQWIPAESLFVRCGVSRVDSMSEIVTSLRFPATRPGQGAAMARISPPAIDGRAPIVVALILDLSSDRLAVSWTSVVIGSTNMTPKHQSDIEEAVQGVGVADERAPGAFAEMVTSEAVARGAVSDDERSMADLSELMGRAFRQAIAMAQQDLSD